MKTLTLDPVRNIINHWWLILLAGLVLLGMGVWIIVSPFQSFLALCWAVAIGMIGSGCFEIIFSLKNYESIKGWGWLLAAGAIDLFIGGYLLNYPLITMVILPLIIGAWILFRGIVAVGNAIHIRSYGFGDWRWLITAGITIVLLALLVLLYPGFGIETLIFWTGVSFIISGLFRIFLSLKFKKLKQAYKEITL